MNTIDRRMPSRPHFARNALSACCVLAALTVIGTAASAERPASRLNMADGRSNAAYQAPVAQEVGATVQQTAYPDTETMLQMYHAARKDGRLDASMSTEYPTLPILKAAYRLLTESGVRSGPQQGEALGQPVASPLFQTKAATCRSETLNCLATAAKQGYDGNFSTLEWARLWACSIAAAGRNQDSPKISSDCTDILAGSAICANANNLCGVVSQPLPTNSSFLGSTTNYTSTVTCANLSGYQAKDRVIKVGSERRTINNVARITRLYFYCSSRAGTWVGVSTTGGTVEYRNCMPSTSSTKGIEGGKAYVLSATGGGLRSMRLRCDDSYSADPGGDVYGPVMADTAGAGTEYRAECLEGEHVWGMRVYWNGSAPAAQQYITGFNFLCRK